MGMNPGEAKPCGEYDSVCKCEKQGFRPVAVVLSSSRPISTSQWLPQPFFWGSWDGIGVTMPAVLLWSTKLGEKESLSGPILKLLSGGCPAQLLPGKPFTGSKPIDLKIWKARGLLTSLPGKELAGL